MDMAFDLNIYFVDLVGFVKQDDTFWALMPNTRNMEQNHFIEDQHFPILVFPKDRAGESAPDCKLGDFGLWFLENDELTLEDFSTNSDLRTNMNHSTNSLPVPGDNDRFSWVIKMKGMDNTKQNSGKVKPEALGNGKLTTDLISARMKLMVGKIESCFFSAYKYTNDKDIEENSKYKIYTYKFEKTSEQASRHESNKPARAIVNIVKANMKVTSQDITIKRSKFLSETQNNPTSSPAKNRDRSTTVTLTPKGNEPLEVMFINLGLVSNLEKYIEKRKNRKNLDHFDHFYPLVDGWGDKPRYIPTRVPSGDFMIKNLSLPEFVGRFKKAAQDNLESLAKKLENHYGTPNLYNENISVMVDLESCPQVRLEPPE